MGSQRVIHNLANKQQSEYFSFSKVRNGCQILSNLQSISMKITTFSLYMVTELDITEQLSMHAHTYQGEEEGNQDKNVNELQVIANVHIHIGYQDEKYS